MTLDLPAHLEEDLKEEAAKEGVAPAERATLLLSICTALLTETETTPFRDAVKEFLSHRSLDAEYVARVLEELVALCLAAHDQGKAASAFQQAASGPDAGGTYPLLRAWRNSMVHRPVDRPFEAPAAPLPSMAERPRRARRARRSAMGKYAHLAGGSDDFAREKQEEIAREEERND